MNDKSELKGIGGWLIFVAIAIIVGIGVDLYTAFLDFGFMNEWEDLAYAFFIEGLVSLILCVYSVYVAKLFFTKDSNLPQMITYLYIINAIWGPIDTILASAVFNEALSGSDIKAMLQPIVHALIWIPYFKKSVRVKNTFINTPKRETGYQKGDLYKPSD